MEVLSKLIKFTKKGIYCPQADIYIDPVKAVDKALITHAHSDHARKGHKLYLAHKHTGLLLRLFFGEKVNVQDLDYDEVIEENGVRISLHPSGHILGAAQVRLEYKGFVVVIAGDYKLENDHVSKPFEPVKCDVFVTESTFARQRYEWPNQVYVFEDINKWWKENQRLGHASFIGAYSLGKSQRLLKGIDYTLGKIYVSETVHKINEVYKKAGIDLPETEIINDEMVTEELKGELIIAPSSFLRSRFINTNQISVAFASGWMLDSYSWRFQNIDKGFVLSDHADFPGLIRAIKATDAKLVYVIHGYSASFTKHLRGMGISAVDANKLSKDEESVELF